MTATSPARWLPFAAALLFFLGALTGILVSAAYTEKIDASHESLLAAHIAALMGCFWLLGLDYTLPRVALGDGARLWMVRLTVLAVYANWLVTVIKSFLKVQGVDYLGEGANDAIFGMLTLTVVIPTLTGSGLWAWGLWRGMGSADQESSPPRQR